MKDNIKDLTIYCTTWCAGCIQIEGFLKMHQIQYKNIDVEQSKAGAKFVLSANDGDLVVPTVRVRFKDRTEIVLKDPTWGELGKEILNN